MGEESLEIEPKPGKQGVTYRDAASQEGLRNLLSCMDVLDVPGDAQDVAGRVHLVGECAGARLALEDGHRFENDVAAVPGEGTSRVMVLGPRC